MNQNEDLLEHKSAHVLNILLPAGIHSVRMHVMPGAFEGGKGESYLLVFAGKMSADEVTLQLYPSEYTVVKHLFPANGTCMSDAVPLEEIVDTLRKVLVH